MYVLVPMLCLRLCLSLSLSGKDELKPAPPQPFTPPTPPEFRARRQREQRAASPNPAAADNSQVDDQHVRAPQPSGATDSVIQACEQGGATSLSDAALDAHPLAFHPLATFAEAADQLGNEGQLISHPLLHYITLYCIRAHTSYCITINVI